MSATATVERRSPRLAMKASAAPPISLAEQAEQDRRAFVRALNSSSRWRLFMVGIFRFIGRIVDGISPGSATPSPSKKGMLHLLSAILFTVTVGLLCTSAAVYSLYTGSYSETFSARLAYCLGGPIIGMIGLEFLNLTLWYAAISDIIHYRWVSTHEITYAKDTLFF